MAGVAVVMVIWSILVSWPACCWSAYYREPTILANRACRGDRLLYAGGVCDSCSCHPPLLRRPLRRRDYAVAVAFAANYRAMRAEEVGRPTDRPGDRLSSERRTLYDRLLDAARLLLTHTARWRTRLEPLPGVRDTNGPSLSSAAHPAAARKDAARKDSACCPMRMRPERAILAILTLYLVLPRFDFPAPYITDGSLDKSVAACVASAGILWVRLECRSFQGRAGCSWRCETVL